ncbi:MAG TPA: hypothetical protein VHI52_15925 [Verrucomicrobiae bacterium]|nr:hypothetical protein [Verrucomicrobiae bacterium]
MTPPGCRFHPRCARAQPQCQTGAPSLEPVFQGRTTRCPYWQTLPAALP